MGFHKVKRQENHAREAVIALKIFEKASDMLRYQTGNPVEIYEIAPGVKAVVAEFKTGEPHEFMLEYHQENTVGEKIHDVHVYISGKPSYLYAGRPGQFPNGLRQDGYDPAPNATDFLAGTAKDYREKLKMRRLDKNTFAHFKPGEVHSQKNHNVHLRGSLDGRKIVFKIAEGAQVPSTDDVLKFIAEIERRIDAHDLVAGNAAKAARAKKLRRGR
ncbi:MAG: YhcH/YjgK/YiaL family protein [Alphaproteobacteria bacterium]|nr:YhcH/YjgK/YiaL family protein [Alphaproteobacteria bacterium]